MADATGQLRLVELDGRKSAPIEHGPTSEQTFLDDVVAMVKQHFIAMNPNDLRFSLVVLGDAGADVLN